MRHFQYGFRERVGEIERERDGVHTVCYTERRISQTDFLSNFKIANTV